MEKVKSFIDNPLMMTMIVEYLKQTLLRRSHERVTLNKNTNAYYKAIENMINLSVHKHTIF